MPDFCTHCQNIGHVVTACRWLYPRKEKDSNADKEKVVPGKKQVTTKRIDWVPLKDNPSEIGSYAAFQAPQLSTQPVPTENVETHVSPQQNQQARDVQQLNDVSQPHQQSPTKEAPTRNFSSTEANPNGIGSSKPFEALVVNNDAADSSTPQEDVTTLQLQSVPTESDLEKRTNSVPILVAATNQDQQNNDT